MNRNGYYRQGQSSRMPYILTIVILVLLYIMNGMNEDRKDADRMFEQVLQEFPKVDSLKVEHKRQVDSLVAVIDWYRKQEQEREAKRKKTTWKVPETKKNNSSTNDSL